jgi:uncharacterized protein (TIGR02646 family)
MAALPTDEARAEYLRKHTSWSVLKVWLGGFSAQKCWYCEATSARAPLDVDHFRPKLRVTVDRAALLGHSGYRWLAYEWTNFRLCCQACNRPEKDARGTLFGKANEFPLQDEQRRCHQAADPLANEQPRLLDPCIEADCALLVHAIDGEVKPAAPPATWEHHRARYTIDLLGFNLPPVPKDKRERWQLLSILIEKVGGTDQVKSAIAAHIKPDHEYASFFHSAISTHRDKAWVDALL